MNIEFEFYMVHTDHWFGRMNVPTGGLAESDCRLFWFEVVRKANLDRDLRLHRTVVWIANDDL